MSNWYTSTERLRERDDRLEKWLLLSGRKSFEYKATAKKTKTVYNLFHNNHSTLERRKLARRTERLIYNLLSGSTWLNKNGEIRNEADIIWEGITINVKARRMLPHETYVQFTTGLQNEVMLYVLVAFCKSKKYFGVVERTKKQQASLNIREAPTDINLVPKMIRNIFKNLSNLSN